MDKDIHLWKMNIKTDSGKAQNPFKFYQDEKLLGCDYKLFDEDDSIIKLKDIDECKYLSKKQYNKNKGFVVVNHAYKNMEFDDLIWIRNEGIFYLCRVIGQCNHKSSEENYKNDILNIIQVNFIKVGTIENVPGKIANCFKARSALQRIHGNLAVEASKIIYNRNIGLRYYNINSIEKENKLNLLLPQDAEEIINSFIL